VENKGLLFIPDISGFTRFVNETEIGHSRLIIQELLEILINANEIGLEVSEIEGDAILFYKYGDEPELESIYRQVEKMFLDFHRSLQMYDLRKFCQCNACQSAVNLTLKVITHYGEFTGYNVKNFNKLIGKDVIVAHQLLKNDIEQHEYWLVTDNLAHEKTPRGIKNWMQWNSSAKQTESGEIRFHFTQLSQLKKEIPPEPELQLELTEKSKLFSLSREYDVNIITLFHASGDYRYRTQWREGVKAIEELGHYLPRVGMRCRLDLENGQSVIYSSSYFYSDERIEFSETDETKKSCTNYILEKLGERKTRLTVNYFARNDFFTKLFANKRNIRNSLEKSLTRLDSVAKGIKLPHVPN